MTKEQIAEAVIVGAGEGAAQGERSGGKHGAAAGAGSGAAAGAFWPSKRGTTWCSTRELLSKFVWIAISRFHPVEGEIESQKI